MMQEYLKNNDIRSKDGTDVWRVSANQIEGTVKCTDAVTYEKRHAVAKLRGLA